MPRFQTPTPVGRIRDPWRIVLFGFLLAAACCFAAESRKAFDVPAGPAETSLKAFSAQAGIEVVFATSTANNVKTNAIKGELAPREALDRMLSGTGLIAEANRQSGGLMVLRDPNAPRAALPASDRPQGVEARTAESSAAPARARSPSAEEAAIELTPFTVSASSNSSWVATETLAGTRLRTDYKDVPNQIETLTKDFMSDLGLNNAQQALIYTANAENNSEFMPAAPGNQVSDPSRAGRVRGAGTATLSRNFFQSSIQSDNYNTESVTIASGPSAILFGLGSPTGIMDASPARANVQRNRYSVSQQFDSENSKRTTWDANFVILPKRLALRVEGLDKKEFTYKKPNLDREDRLYGAITITPFSSTTITLQGERVDRAWNNAPRIAPVEFITPWLYANQIAGSGYTTPKPTFNNNNLNGIANNVIFAQRRRLPCSSKAGPCR